ncbi:tetratricopeptide repeat protein [Sporolactobacillus vineae]|uniref:tetratricopeptide repeat protein n=1 Tax=Sporolactobacillus vineae TaxID=444463 RepID=UPI000287B5C9|nr:tetratricopeptide repeat protein [Sporolactobacillus vineae]
MSKEDHLHHAQVIPLRMDGDFFYQKGMACYQKGELEQARKLLDRALRIKPNEVEYLCQQAAILSELEDYEPSISLLKKVVHELDGRMTECYFFIANNYAYLGDFEAALSEVKTYMALEPHGVFDHEARELYAMLTSEDGKSVQEQEPSYVGFHERGRAALEHGRFEESVYWFKKVIHEQPDYLPARNNLAVAYYSMDAADQAIQEVEEVLAKDPGNIHALCNLAAFFHQTGRTGEWKAVLDRLDNIYPMNPEHCGKLGSTFLFAGNYPKAYYWLKCAERRGVRCDQVFFFWLALAACRTGRLEEAETCWKQVDYFSDKPFHPFKYAKIQELMFDPAARNNFMIRDLIGKEIQDGGRPYQLFALFYSAGFNDEQMLEQAAQHSTDATVSNIAGRFLNERQSAQRDERLAIMRSVESLTGGEQETMKHPELYSFWLIVDALIGSDRNTDRQGWAGTLYYLWKKEFGNHVSQKDVASKAGTTVYRIRKHVAELTRALDNQWEEKQLHRTNEADFRA